MRPNTPETKNIKITYLEPNEDDSSRFSSTSFQDESTNLSFQSVSSDLSLPKPYVNVLNVSRSERKLIQARQRRRKAYETSEFFPLGTFSSKFILKSIFPL